MKPYRIAVTARFKRSFRSLPKEVQERVYRAILGLMESPFIGVKLRGELSGLWRLRVGEYRIIYAIEEETRRVVLLDVGHRRAIY